MLFVVGKVVRAVWLLLCVVCCLMVYVWCLLYVDCCRLYVALAFVVRCVLFVVC